VFSLSEADVRKVSNQVNSREDVGPDGVPGCDLRACAEQLTGIFTVIFHFLLVPVCNPHVLI
jgi:hypothetical protein